MGGVKGNPVHVVLSCNHCGEEWTDYRTAQRKAAKHAREKNHHVSGEIAYRKDYYGSSLYKKG